MGSRPAKIVRLIGLISTNGSHYNDLKLEQLLKIAGQPDISIEIDEDDGDASQTIATTVTKPTGDSDTRGTKRVSDVTTNSEQPAKRRGRNNAVISVVQIPSRDQVHATATRCVCVGSCNARCVCFIARELAARAAAAEASVAANFASKPSLISLVDIKASSSQPASTSIF